MNDLLDYINKEQEKLFEQLETEENMNKITEIHTKLQTLEEIKNEHLKGE